MSPFDATFRKLVSELREERDARRETFVGPDQPADESPRDALKNLTYSELSTVCGCGRKTIGNCRLCAAVDDQEQRQRRIGP